MFYKVKLDNFKGFAHFEIDFKEGKTKNSGKKIVIIYGENGIGKTTIVDAFQLLRDSSVSLLNLKDFNFSASLNDLSESERLRFYDDANRRSKISYFIQNLKTVSSTDPMSLTFYGFDLSGRNFEYSMVFDNNSIIEESLISDGKIIFLCKTNNKIKHSISNNKEFISKLNDYKELYFGSHSILSCVSCLMDNFSDNFVKESISPSFLEFYKEVYGMDIFKTLNNNFEKFSYTNNSKLLTNVVSGMLFDDDDICLKNTKKVLSTYFTGLYRNIIGIDYDVVSIDETAKRYSLVFIENIAGKITRIPYSLESIGTRKLVSLFTYFYGLYSSNSTFIIDEIDSGISSIMLKNIIESFDINSFKGQLIMTTHNLLLMNEAMKKNIYILNRVDNGTIEAKSLDFYKREIQSKTDVVGKFLKNHFGGIPKNSKLRFKDLIIED